MSDVGHTAVTASRRRRLFYVLPTCEPVKSRYIYTFTNADRYTHPHSCVSRTNGITSMEDRPVQPETEAELEAFRRQWRDEVSARNKKPEVTPKAPNNRQRLAAAAAAPIPGPSTVRRKVETDYDEIVPQPYHDLPNKEEHLKLGVDGQNHDRDGVFKEPSSALEHYERAVEKETHGQLGDSLKHYRTAFKVGVLHQSISS